MKKALLFALVILAVLLTSCSGGDKTESETSDTNSVAPAPSCRELLMAAIDIAGSEDITVYSDADGDEDVSFLVSELYGSIDVIPDMDKIGDAAIFLPDNQVVNEVHIIKPESEDDSSVIEGYLENRFERLKVMYVGYDAEQAGYASNSKIVEYKGYYIFVATKDKNDEIIDAVKNSIDG